MALHNHHDAYQVLPPSFTATVAYIDGATDTTPGWGWATYILPYIEQENVFRQLNLKLPVQNSPAIQTMVKAYLCSSDLTPPSAFAIPDAFGTSITQAAPSSYATCVGGDESGSVDSTGLGIFYRNSRTRLDLHRTCRFASVSGWVFSTGTAAPAWAM